MAIGSWVVNSLMNRKGREGGSGAAWLAVKGAFVGVIATIMFAGIVAMPGPDPIGFGAILLIPSVIYLLGVWSPRLVLVFGGLLVGLTAATWLLYELQKDQSMAGVGIVAGGFWSFVAALGGVSLEIHAWERTEAAGNSTRQSGPIGPGENDDSGRGRPRAW